MNRKKPILSCKVVDRSGPIIDEIIDVYHLEYLPLSVTVKKQRVDLSSLNGWFKNRKIPASRQNIDRVLADINLTSTDELLLKDYGLSLSDQYWFKPKSSSIEWEDINYFDHSFSEDMGRKLLDQPNVSDSLSLQSPDNTSDGWLKKAWKIIDGKRYLLKGGSSPFQQEPFNEVVASTIAHHLSFSCVDYQVFTIKDQYYSACEDFIDRDTELIPAWHLVKKERRPNHLSPYNWYLKVCHDYGMEDVQASVDDMLVLDFLIGNTDRHYNNFGVIRDARTLEMKGSAPIYDSGTSLFYNELDRAIHIKKDTPAKPFRTTQFKQIELVDLSDYDFSRLHGIDEEVESIYSKSAFSKLMSNPSERILLLTDFIKTRQNYLEHQQSLTYQKKLYNHLAFDNHSLNIAHEEGTQETFYDDDDLEL